MSLGLGLGVGLLRGGRPSAAKILAQGRDLIAGSTRTFSRASQKYSVYRPNTVLAVDEIDEKTDVEIFPGVRAHGVYLGNSYTRVNDRNPAGNFASVGTFTVDGVEPSKYTWTQAAPGESVNFCHRLTISNSAAYYWQFKVAKNTTGRVRLRVRDSAGTDTASIDFDLVTGTLMNPLFTGNGGNHAFTWQIVIDMGTEWAVMVRWAAVTADGTTGSNGQVCMWLTDDAGSVTGAAIPSQVISFVQMTANGLYPPYVPGAGLAVASAADTLILDPLPIAFNGPGEIWSFVVPNRWGAPFTQGGGNRYLFGWGPLDAPSTEPWRNIGMNVTTASGGQAQGGGNLGRGNGGGATPASVSAYSGTQGNYWNDQTRQYLGGSWNNTRSQVVFDALSVPGAASIVSANLPAGAQPPRTFNRLNMYVYGSASNPAARTAVWGWNRQLSPAERTVLSGALLRTTFAQVYP